MTSLDAAGPMVLDTRPLHRRAGAMAVVDRTLPAPQGWEISSCGVEPGSEVRLKVRMEAVVEGVLVTGDAAVLISGECSRCLLPTTAPLTVDVQELFEYADLQRSLPAGAVEDVPLPTLDGDLLDFEPTLRDAVVLDLPAVPLCSPDCLGLCPECGVRLADAPGHGHDVIDDRWSGLQAWSAGAASAPQGDQNRTEQDRTETKGQ